MLALNQDHEKINILSVDLRSIYNNLVEDAQSRLDLHLPSYDNDHMKLQIGENLQDFLLDVFSMALSALVIDGNDRALLPKDELADLLSLKPAEVVEPFDVNLNSQLREVLEQVEKETTILAMLRKDLPALSKAHFEALALAVDERVAALKKDIDSADNSDDDSELHDRLSGLLPTLDQAAKDYAHHIADLSRLKSLVPDLQAKLVKENERCELLLHTMDSTSPT